MREEFAEMELNERTNVSQTKSVLLLLPTSLICFCKKIHSQSARDVTNAAKRIIGSIVILHTQSLSRVDDQRIIPYLDAQWKKF